MTATANKEALWLSLCDQLATDKNQRKDEAWADSGDSKFQEWRDIENQILADRVVIARGEKDMRSLCIKLMLMFQNP